MLKKLLMLLLLVCIGLLLYACGGGGTSTTTSTSSATTTTSTDTPTSLLTTSTSTTTTIALATTTTTTTNSTTTTLYGLVWTYPAESIYMSAVALDDDDNIYIGTGHKQGSQECYLYSLDSNGTLNWKYDVGYGKSVVGAPAIGPSGNIYFIVVSYSAGNRGIYLHAIDSLGGVGWISDNLFRGGAEEQFDIEEWTPAISSQEVIYASVTGGLYAFSQEGTALWSWTEPAYYTKFSSAAISSDETIYINVDERDAGSGGLYAFSSSGSQEWQYPISSAIYFSSPVIGGDGTIYFGRGSPSGTNDSYIYALNPDGEFLWKFYTGLVVVYAPSIGSDGTIYAGTTAKGGSREAGQGGIFFALNSNGEERWRYDTSADQMEFYEDNLAQADIYNSPAIGDDGTIYFASEGRYFYAFDPDGNPVQKYDMYALVPDCQFTTFNSPAISSNGTIYIGDYYYRFNSETGTTEGAIYALQSPSAGLADSPWPKFHNNNKNTGRNN